MLAIEELDAEQRASLMRLAEWGEEKDGKRKPWPTGRLVQERDKVLGREKAPLPDFGAKREAEQAEWKKPDRGLRN